MDGPKIRFLSAVKARKVPASRTGCVHLLPFTADMPGPTFHVPLGEHPYRNRPDDQPEDKVHRGSAATEHAALALHILLVLDDKFPRRLRAMTGSRVYGLSRAHRCSPQTLMATALVGQPVPACKTPPFKFDSPAPKQRPGRHSKPTSPDRYSSSHNTHSLTFKPDLW